MKQGVSTYCCGSNVLMLCFLLLMNIGTVLANVAEPISFIDISKQSDSGIDFSRIESSNDLILDALKQQGVVGFGSPQVLANTPIKPRGAPGIAIFDFDNDGDKDVFVTNGPGRSNALYSNQFKETGKLRFIEMASQLGLDSIDLDNTGVCFGDIDNDDDQDLLVLGNSGYPNTLYENQSGKSFVNISINTGLSSPEKTPASCAFGDINNDGLLDIVIGNTYRNWDHRLTSLSFDFDHLLEENQLFINNGGGFSDITQHSGIAEPARITWAVALVDYDLDGDLDFIAADDQGPKPASRFGGRDDGYVRVYQNNGAGFFNDVTEEVGTNRFGAWMGLSFGDLNNDGYMDIFATNSGDYFHVFLDPLLPYEAEVEDFSTGWFLGDQQNRFVFPGAGDLKATPFGWGTAVIDYDNDSDSDVVFYGGANMGAFVDASNSGTILENDGSANFNYYQRDTIPSQHNRRNVQGLAVGDLNEDGFFDIVSVSSENWPEPFPLVPYLPEEQLFGSPFDGAAFTWPIFQPIDATFNDFQWTGLEPVDGNLSVEISSASQGNRWVKVLTKGSVGKVTDAVVNRSGIGAVILFTPNGSKQTAMHPVLGGSSYASQHSREWIFGLGQKHRGTLEILWPGGVRNKLYNVRAGEKIVFPEIPCSFDTQGHFYAYFKCIKKSLNQLKRKNMLTQGQKIRFARSAIRAYFVEKFRVKYLQLRGDF